MIIHFAENLLMYVKNIFLISARAYKKGFVFVVNLFVGVAEMIFYRWTLATIAMCYNTQSAYSKYFEPDNLIV